MKIKIAVISFPGNNCEVESMRAVKNAGMEPVFFKWNDSKEKLKDVSGYFLPGGFAYEDRGRAGMIAARDPLMKFIAEEADAGKTVIGVCNGAQILVESGLIPFGKGLRMSLAKNAVGHDEVGFLNEWIWIKPTCAQNRCAASGWDGAMKLPIAHGEGRFATKDIGVIEELKRNDQIVFCYCDHSGNVSDEPPVCPNGSLFGAAGICNTAGNVVAIMPHPERSSEGVKFFQSLKMWLSSAHSYAGDDADQVSVEKEYPLKTRQRPETEIFIDTIITNNEERSMEQAAKRVAPKIKVKQLKYFAPKSNDILSVLSHLNIYNPNKEIAYVRRNSAISRWNPNSKKEEPAGPIPFDDGIAILRRSDIDSYEKTIGGGESGICYLLGNIPEQLIRSTALLEVFANPHSSTLELLD